MSHHESAHHAGRQPPRRTPYVFKFVLFREELHLERFGKILPQKVRCTGLEGFSVLHHSLDAQRIVGPGKAFVSGFGAADHGHGHPLFGEGGVDFQHLPGFGLCFLGGGVGGVALLPEKLGGAQKQARSHFPAYYVGPLVDEQRQVAVALNPVFVGTPDHGLRGGPHNQFLFQLGVRVNNNARSVFGHFQAVVSDHGALFGKACHVRGFFAEV